MNLFCKTAFSVLLCLCMLSCKKADKDPAPAANTTTTTPKAPTVTVFAGDGKSGYMNGQGTESEFVYPVAIAIDKNGYLYIADYGNNIIRKISADGLASTFSGCGTAGSDDGVNALASFNHPSGLAVDKDGNVIVADQYNNTIRKIAPNGTVTTLAGSPMLYGSTDGQGTSASFYGPTGVAIDSHGNIYVTDQGNNCIRMITPDGTVTTLAGSVTSGSSDGQGTAASFNQPTCLAINSLGNIYVTDQGNNRIRMVTPAGLVTTLAGSTAGYTDATGSAAQFNKPFGIAVDSVDNIYLADQTNNVIRKITPTGVVTTFTGNGTAGAQNGSLLTSSYNDPTGVVFDKHNNMFVTDGLGYTIRKISF